MKRVAAHYLHIYSGEQPKALHYIELDNEGRFRGCFPLEREIESVSFYNGILFMTERNKALAASFLLKEFQGFQQASPAFTAFQVMDLSGYLLLDPNDSPAVVDLFLLDGLDLSSPKFRTNDGRCYGHIQRL